MKRISLANICFLTCLLSSIGLMVVGFMLPPPGIIDGSVLSAVGELFGFATLAQLPSLIHGRSVEMKHGNTTLTLGDNDGNSTEENSEERDIYDRPPVR